MTDVETLIVAKLNEIHESQTAFTKAFTEHVAKDAETFGKIKEQLAESKGRVSGAMLVIGAVGGILGALVPMAFKLWTGW